MLPTNLETAVYGLIVTPALHIADKTGMLSHLLPAPLSAGEVSDRIGGADVDAVERLLLVLTAHDILNRRPDGRYLIAGGMAPYLDSSSPDYIGGFVTHLVEEAAGRLATMEANLFHRGDPMSAGISAPYDHFYRDTAATSDFMAAMWSLSYGVSRELAALADLAGYRTLVDVGGANGPFAVAALEISDQLNAIVFDLPHIEPYVEQTRDTRGLGHRLAFVGGDFFRDELPSGEVIALGYVMSNWPDEQCIELLVKARNACAEGGKVLVMDRLFDDDKGGPMSTAAMNLTMKVETYGVHRTVAEFGELFKAAGFGHYEVKRSTRDKHLLIAPR